MLETYYASRDTLNRIRQKSSDLRRIVQTALERNRKKYALQQKQMKDTAKKDKYKVYGELINTYGYGLEEGCKSFKALNYYTNEEITIPLDPTLTPQEMQRNISTATANSNVPRKLLPNSLPIQNPRSSIWNPSPTPLISPSQRVI
mgnify:CR=1 FL=1